jgi:hypothetical protein
MNKIYLYYFVNFVILFLIICQESIKKIVKSLNEKIKKGIPELESALEKLKNKEIDFKYTKSEFKKEKGTFYLLEEKKSINDFHFLTKTIGWFEIFFFASTTIILLKYGKNFIDSFQFLMITAAGWIGLKIFGNYQQWSGKFLGRSVFYIFLIGSIVNILGAIGIGWIIFLFDINFCFK